MGFGVLGLGVWGMGDWPNPQSPTRRIGKYYLI
jgi:hypothetical protein